MTQALPVNALLLTDSAARLVKLPKKAGRVLSIFPVAEQLKT
jgi:hypothetical protein